MAPLPKLFTRTILAGLVACFTLASAQWAEAASLRRSNWAEPQSLDPHHASGVWESAIIGDMFLGLMTENAKGEPIYGAAEFHTVSDDGLIYTFLIRKNMNWSDGKPVTAEDFVFAFRRILAPETAAEYASILYPVANAQAVNRGDKPPTELGIMALDEKRLQITLGQPTPYFLSLLTHYTAAPVPAHIVLPHGARWTKPENIVVNGAYTLREWVPNSHITLIKNSAFYDSANVAIDDVTFIPMPDLSSALKRFRASELEIVHEFPAREFQKLKTGGYEKVSPSEVHVHPYTATIYIQFNLTQPPFDNVKVRRALTLAIDREIITERVLGTGQVPAYAFVPPGMPNYIGAPQMDFKTWPKQKRLDEAKRLLDEAGFNAQNPLKFDFRYRDDQDIKRMTTAIAGMWREIGVQAQPLNTDRQVHYAALRVQDFAVADAGWVADYNDAENYLFLLQSSTGQLNYGKYNNATYDALMAQAAATPDLEARAGLLKQAEVILLTDLPLAPVFYSVSRSLVSSRVSGWVDNVSNIHRTRYLKIVP